ncbi:30S ribosomal protein S20 [Candidatus Shikimatogenerans silvanidophilus]|uniref:30S ribosomal protein S20 n=1 Tax=Candidatus Shikimatogenerans silvanidophilus TaxID=2782547 RepID=UPI001BA53EC7|nr:30S ribosomal protein S20 [Candidatus Shikimatogenerans silvanidophilus]
MANHKSAIKEIRKNKKKKIKNKYKFKSLKTKIKKLIKSKNLSNIKKEERKVYSMIDKLIKKNIIHKNKASRLKSKFNFFIKKLNK